MSTSFNRREFIKTLSTALALGPVMMSLQSNSNTGIPTRPLGKTGVRIPIIGVGGWDIGQMAKVKGEDQAIRTMQNAIDEGVTFFDNCWDYHNGYSEEVMGKAMKGRRDQVFLMTKVCARDYEHGKQHLEDSLSRLQTDVIDLYQFHAIKHDDDAALIFDEDNGGLKMALEAQKQGKIRFIGFTGHQSPNYHQSMLDRDFEWDTVQMPLNMIDTQYESFQKDILPQCVKRNTGIIGMKALAGQNGRIVRELGVSAQDCRRYTLSLPVSSLVCGIQSQEDLKQDIAIARNFTPMTQDELYVLLEKTKDANLSGEIEKYKTGNFGCDWHHKNAL